MLFNEYTILSLSYWSCYSALIRTHWSRTQRSVSCHPARREGRRSLKLNSSGIIRLSLNRICRGRDWTCVESCESLCFGNHIFFMNNVSINCNFERLGTYLRVLHLFIQRLLINSWLIRVLFEKGWSLSCVIFHRFRQHNILIFF